MLSWDSNRIVISWKHKWQWNRRGRYFVCVFGVCLKMWKLKFSLCVMCLCDWNFFWIKKKKNLFAISRQILFRCHCLRPQLLLDSCVLCRKHWWWPLPRDNQLFLQEELYLGPKPSHWLDTKLIRVCTLCFHIQVQVWNVEMKEGWMKKKDSTKGSKHRILRFKHCVFRLAREPCATTSVIFLRNSNKEVKNRASSVWSSDNSSLTLHLAFSLAY